MSPSVTPFSQAQQNFQNQLNQFDQFAQQGFPLSNFLTTSAPQSSTTGPQSSTTQNVSALGTLGKLIYGPASSQYSISRLIAAMLGILLIAGAIFIFGIEGIDAAVDSRAGRVVKQAGEIFA